jgi:hypothetical protein
MKQSTVSDKLKLAVGFTPAFTTTALDADDAQPLTSTFAV